MIVAENRGFRREIIWDFFLLIWDFFAIFCQASRYRARFQASSGHSDSANRRGYEAVLSAKTCKNPCTISVFQKLWPFVSTHVRAFPTFKPISKSTDPRRFYYNYSLPASKLGLISNKSFVEFNSSVRK